MQRRKRLICCCCNGEATGRQWWNRDKGYGICAPCFSSIKEAGRDTTEDLERSYGREGVHHSLAEVGVHDEGGEG